MLHINGGHYIIDMDRPIWVFLFPMIYWFIPHTVYRIDDESILKELKDVKVERQNTTISPVGIGGISLILVNLTNPILKYFNLGTETNVNIAIVIFAVFVLVLFRVYVSKMNRTKIEESIDFTKLPTEKLYIWPTSIKHILFTISYYLFTLILTLFFVYVFIFESNATYLFGFTIMLIFLFISNVTVASMERFKVKFQKNVDEK